MRKVVFDIETKNIFQDVGSNNPADLDIAVVGIYDYETDKYLSFTEEEFPKMWPYFDRADMLVTFTGDHFDIPLLNKYYKKAGRGDLTSKKSMDVLTEIKKQYGRRMKLDQLAEGTFGINKSGSGFDAIVWWRTGRLEEIRKYCLDDVKITRDIYEFAMKNKKLMFKEGPFVKEIKLDTKHWDPVQEMKTGSLF